MNCIYKMKVNASSIRIILAVLISFVVEMKANLINVALSKETTQSSAYFGPDQAVDGNTEQNHVLARCAHTDQEYQPYWEVDLGASYVIAFVKVYNRIDCCSDRLTNLQVSVSTDNVIYSRYGYHQGAITSTFEFHPESPFVVGRWVKLTLLGITGYLVLCEVEIMANSRDFLRSVDNVEGTGTTIASIPAVSKIQCMTLCVQKKACNSVNIRQDITSSIECQLLNHVTYNATTDKNVTFWTMLTDIPNHV